jgi:hypothetical protein
MDFTDLRAYAPAKPIDIPGIRRTEPESEEDLPLRAGSPWSTSYLPDHGLVWMGTDEEYVEFHPEMTLRLTIA